MKVVITGGRSFHEQWAAEALSKIHHNTPITEIVEGGASGADTLARSWALENNIKCTTMPANWAKYGKSAGPLRNKEMLATNPKYIIAFPGGKGTQNMCSIAKSAGIQVIYIRKNKNLRFTAHND